MDALEKRVQDRMAVEARQLRQEQVRLAKQKVTLVKDAEKAHAASTKLFGVLQTDGGKPTKTVAEAGAKALKTLAQAARSLEKVNASLAANSQTLAKLDDPAERQRRVKAAQSLGVTDGPVTGVDAMEMVLIQSGKAMHITDLADRTIETGIVRLTGKTPTQTLSAYAAKEVAKPDGRFVRVAPGVFDLRTRQTTKA